MRQTKLRLNESDRELIESYRSKGFRNAREVNRAHILAALDRGLSERQIMEVLGIGRGAIWRTRVAYLEGGAEYALHDIKRPGKPRIYGTNVEAKISALVRTRPPQGATRWTIASLRRAARGHEEIGNISHETVRRLVKRCLAG